MLGTNDAALCREHLSGNFIDDYITLTKHYQTFASEPKLWIVKPPHIFSDICLSVEVFERYIIPAIEQIAFRTNFQIIDAYSVVNSSEYFLDGVHPNVRGARMIAQEVYKSINSVKPNYHQP